MKDELPVIVCENNLTNPVEVVSVPRSKAYFKENQLQFYNAISVAVNSLGSPFCRLY